jgi:histidine ammonia-lyase
MNVPETQGITVLVTTADFSLDDLRAVALDRARVELGADAMNVVEVSHAVVLQTSLTGTVAYGLNTGLGHGRTHRHDGQDLTRFGRQIIDAHATGVGPHLSEVEVRALMVTRLIGLTRGGSGIHPATVRVLTAMLNAGIHPLVPREGSVGASDLTHMAAIAQVVSGGGWATFDGERIRGEEALSRADIIPHAPSPKDALSLISGNAASIGLGAFAVHEAAAVVALADMAGVLSLEAIDGNLSPFRVEVAATRHSRGQVAVAEHIRFLLAGSDLHARTPSAVQDPLSFRVMPQVHGALRVSVATAAKHVEAELNARTDNPLVSVEHGELISNGNFQVVELALAFETLRIALAHVGMLSERRMNKIVRFTFGSESLYESGDAWVPGRLADEGMLAYSAASLLARLKWLAQPATLHAPPLDFDVEDHATMAPLAVEAAREATSVLESILAVEVTLAVDRLATRPSASLSPPLTALRGQVEAALHHRGGQTIGETIGEVRRIMKEFVSNYTMEEPDGNTGSTSDG